MVTKVYLVRHCQSEGNGVGLFHGRFDSPVSETGRRQLELLSLRFRNTVFDRIYSSPLMRAYETAQAICRFHPKEIEILPDLIEMDGGELEDMPFDEAKRLYPELISHWDNEMDLCEFPKGEKMSDVYERAGRVVKKIIEDNLGGTVACATHGGVLMNLYARVECGDITGLRRHKYFGNTGVTILEDEDGVWRFSLLDDLSHLPEDLRPAFKSKEESGE